MLPKELTHRVNDFNNDPTYSESGENITQHVNEAFLSGITTAKNYYEQLIPNWTKIEDRNLTGGTYVFFNTKKHGILYGKYIIDNGNEEWCKVLVGQRKDSYYDMDSITHIQDIKIPAPPKD